MLGSGSSSRSQEVWRTARLDLAWNFHDGIVDYGGIRPPSRELATLRRFIRSGCENVWNLLHEEVTDAE